MLKRLYAKIKAFVTPASAEVLAQISLEESKRQYLVYKSTEEEAKFMAKFYEEKIKRLEIYLKGKDNVG